MHVAAARALAVVLWKATGVRAVRIIAELRLLRRTAEMNSRGVAPHSKMIAEMLIEEWPAHVLQPGITSWLSRLPLEPNLRRRWLVRLRRFWGVHYRKLGSRAHLSPADERRKVREHKHQPPSQFLEPHLTPHLGVKNAAPQLAFGLQKQLGRYPNVGPETVPQLWGQELVPKYVMEW